MSQARLVEKLKMVQFVSSEFCMALDQLFLRMIIIKQKLSHYNDRKCQKRYLQMDNQLYAGQLYLDNSRGQDTSSGQWRLCLLLQRSCRIFAVQTVHCQLLVIKL